MSDRGELRSNPNRMGVDVEVLMILSRQEQQGALGTPIRKTYAEALGALGIPIPQRVNNELEVN